MQHSFGDFLRHGGNGQYVIAQRDGRIVGRRLGLALKSTFPNYSALRGRIQRTPRSGDFRKHSDAPERANTA